MGKKLRVSDHAAENMVDRKIDEEMIKAVIEDAPVKFIDKNDGDRRVAWCEKRNITVILERGNDNTIVTVIPMKEKDVEKKSRHWIKRSWKL